MIAVIADDLTGAAELAGIGLTYGLSVELVMQADSESAELAATADLLVIATDARSVPEPIAVQEMTAATAAAWSLKPDLLYKKVDSVLRGYVLAETEAQMQVMGLKKALIVSANPALGRTLVDGHYYIHGVAIDQTHFAQDPEFPVWHSEVLTRLGADTRRVTVQSARADFPEEGIVIGEATSTADLADWTQGIDKQTFLGGASGFFTALLNARGLHKQSVANTAELGASRLYVCGTAFGKSVALVQAALSNGHSVCYMPKALVQAGPEATVAVDTWAAAITLLLKKGTPVIIAIEPGTSEERYDALHLRESMAATVRQVLAKVAVDELIIEGGSTASAILRQIGVQRLAPVQELGPGVIRMQAIEQPQLHITMKPGSYVWPDTLWTF